MKLHSMLPIIVTFPIALAACQSGAGPLTESDRAAINEVREAYRSAVLATDAAAIAATYVADGVEMPPNMPAAEGRDAIQARNEPLVAVTDFQINSLEVAGHGDVAFDRGTYTFTGNVEGMAEAIVDTGKYVMIARKQPDGSWLAARAIWNSDLPLPAPPESPTP